MREYNPDRCVVCGKASLYGFTHPACQGKTALDGVLSIFHYEGVLPALLKGIKYRLVTSAQREMLQVVKPAEIEKFYHFRRIVRDADIQAIPLHSQRQKARGFNQSIVFARWFSHLFGYSFVNFLERNKAAMPQASIHNRALRRGNIKNSYILKENSLVIGKTIILVDDVITTGATMNEAALVLKRAGAKKVFGFSYARG